MVNVLMVNNKDKRFKSLDFVLTSVEKKDKLREVLYNKIYVTKDKIYGADGYRLNCVTNTIDFDNDFGIWEVIKHTKTEITLLKSDYVGKYPNVEEIIESTKNYRKENFENNNSNFNIFTYFIMNKLNICINIDLLNDIYKFIPKSNFVEVYHDELFNSDVWTYDKSIKVEWFEDNITYKSILMAFRMKKGEI